MEPSSLLALVRQYIALSNDDKARFLAVLAQDLKAEGVSFLMTKLQRPVQLRLAQHMSEQTVSSILPMLISGAVEVAKKSPGVPDEELERNCPVIPRLAWSGRL